VGAFIKKRRIDIPPLLFFSAPGKCLGLENALQFQHCGPRIVRPLQAADRRLDRRLWKTALRLVATYASFVDGENAGGFPTTRNVDHEREFSSPAIGSTKKMRLPRFSKRCRGSRSSTLRHRTTDCETGCMRCNPGRSPATSGGLR